MKTIIIITSLLISSVCFSQRETIQIDRITKDFIYTKGVNQPDSLPIMNTKIQDIRKSPNMGGLKLNKMIFVKKNNDIYAVKEWFSRELLYYTIEHNG